MDRQPSSVSVVPSYRTDRETDREGHRLLLQQQVAQQRSSLDRRRTAPHPWTRMHKIAHHHHHHKHHQQQQQQQQQQPQRQRQRAPAVRHGMSDRTFLSGPLLSFRSYGSCTVPLPPFSLPVFPIFYYPLPLQPKELRFVAPVSSTGESPLFRPGQ
jgi:hypothetical protein